MADKEEKKTKKNLGEIISDSFFAGLIVGLLIMLAMTVAPLKTILTSGCGVYVYHKGDTIYDACDKYAECADKGKKTVLVIGSPDMEFLQETVMYYDYIYRDFEIGYEISSVTGGTLAFIPLDTGTRADEENLDTLTDMIIEFMPEGLSDAEKTRYFHDYLCETGTSTAGNSGAYILLTDGIGECASYTEAYRILLTKTGIKNGIQLYYKAEGSHVWNWYEIDGEVYYTDAFWDYCSYKRYLEEKPDSGLSAGDLKFQSYNMSAEKCAETHYISPYMPLECGK